MTQTEEKIVVELLPARGGRKVARAILDAPATLNSLTTGMVEQLLASLQSWAADDSVACVFIEGAGEKAFCAGGDVQMLRRSSVENPGGPCAEAEQFFALEYRMNYTIHTYNKPIVVWGDRIVMGGGLGILAGASHRVVTETSRFAMPEITIALFPDVGGSYFLNQMPGKAGRFLALTGASFNAADALYTGIADYFVRRDEAKQVLEGLLGIAEAGTAGVSELLARYQASSIAGMPDGNVPAHREIIDQLCSGETVQEVYAALQSWQGDDKWIARARDGLLHGSPLAACWIDAQLHRSAGKPLAEVFRSELVLATNIVRHSEFAEGVRALLVDKDRKPNWQYRRLEDIPADFVGKFFEPPWPQNPLADL